jgi:hypothetical protein
MVALPGGLACLRSPFNLSFHRWREWIAQRRVRPATGTALGHSDPKHVVQPYFHGEHEALFWDAAMQREMYRL